MFASATAVYWTDLKRHRHCIVDYNAKIQIKQSKILQLQQKQKIFNASTLRIND